MLRHVARLALCWSLVAWPCHAQTGSLVTDKPQVLTLRPGEIHTFTLGEIARVAVGDEEVLDFTLVSSTELMVRAMALGSTNLIVWDAAGQQRWRVEVVDISPQSVQLRVQLIEVVREASKKFGADWMDSLTFTETTFGALGPTDVSQAARLGQPFRIGALSRSNFSAVLHFLMKNGDARILAEPKLVAASGKQAVTTIGVEVPIITATSISAGTVTQQIEFRQTGVELKFRPTVLQREDIQLVVDAKVSSVDMTSAISISGILVPGFRVRHAQTEIVIPSGEPVLIAGLIQDEEKKNLDQVPGIGSVPLLGSLFRSRAFTKGETELVVVVTPLLQTAPKGKTQAASADAPMASPPAAPVDGQ